MKKRMKKLTILLLLLGASLAHADLQTLDNQALQAVEAQAGADLSLKLSLNHTSTYQFDDAVGGACDKTAMSNTGLGYCHLGISVNKRFVKATRAEMTPFLPKGSDFEKLQKRLMDASKPGGKNVLTGKEIGLTSSMAEAKIQLYDFSSDEINVTATEVSAKYAQVEFNDLIKLLFDL